LNRAQRAERLRITPLRTKPAYMPHAVWRAHGKYLEISKDRANSYNRIDHGNLEPGELFLVEKQAHRRYRQSRQPGQVPISLSQARRLSYNAVRAEEPLIPGTREGPPGRGFDYTRFL
jgi:hypothetical protein